ncbi:Micronuclear linker histone polyprotein-like protein [Cucumis melo var. makuwa]|uniref:Micronuclear linker histone polyprotein-like protein n=2 Tax=Cucumis melo TaxID=3656 RepID=A0A5D3BRY2_CUCMM|nr:Micronuclear linker histone polyprotein-like protein [Cucumis melo var. makuwa]
MGSVGSLQSKASSSRGRSYALMLLIAFGAALLGVMLLHKFRERRICNLLLKRTDQDLRSFQLLFQKETDRSKELAKSLEDMTAALYLLRSQKMELDRRLLELQSTIDSLRDEQKITSVALQEKQREIKALREKEIDSGNDNPQVVALTQSLKQKEDELEELRRRHKSPGAIAANDSSDPRGDSTMSEEKRDQLLESGNGKGESESMDNNRGGSTSTGFHEIETQKLEETHEGEEERQKQEKLGDEGENANGREVEGETKITNEHKEKEGGDFEEVENGRANKIARSEIRMKTETGKYGNTRKIRGKRWRYIVKRRAVDNGWRLISKKMKKENGNNRNLNDIRAIGTTHGKFTDGAEEKMKEERTQEAKENLMEKENKMVQEENLNSENDDTSREKNGNGDVGDDRIKKNPGEEMEPNDLKSKEKEEPERGTDFKEDGKEEEENKEEPEESEF